MVPFGLGTDTPVVGDWDGDGYANLGVRRATDRSFYLSLPSGTVGFKMGNRSDLPVAGDWNGDRLWEVGVRKADSNVFRLRKPDGHAYAVRLGKASDIPVTGDWNGDGTTDLGVYDITKARFTLRIQDANGLVWLTRVLYGMPGDLPVTGDWDGNGRTDLGVWRPGQAMFFQRIAASPTAPMTKSVSRVYGTPRSRRSPERPAQEITNRLNRYGSPAGRRAEVAALTRSRPITIATGRTGPVSPQRSSIPRGHPTTGSHVQSARVARPWRCGAPDARVGQREREPGVGRPRGEGDGPGQEHGLLEGHLDGDGVGQPVLQGRDAAGLGPHAVRDLPLEAERLRRPRVEVDRVAVPGHRGVPPAEISGQPPGMPDGSTSSKIGPLGRPVTLCLGAGTSTGLPTPSSPPEVTSVTKSTVRPLACGWRFSGCTVTSRVSPTAIGRWVVMVLVRCTPPMAGKGNAGSVITFRCSGKPRMCG